MAGRLAPIMPNDLVCSSCHPIMSNDLVCRIQCKPNDPPSTGIVVLFHLSSCTANLWLGKNNRCCRHHRRATHRTCAVHNAVSCPCHVMLCHVHAMSCCVHVSCFVRVSHSFVVFVFVVFVFVVFVCRLCLSSYRHCIVVAWCHACTE